MSAASSFQQQQQQRQQSSKRLDLRLYTKIFEARSVLLSTNDLGKHQKAKPCDVYVVLDLNKNCQRSSVAMNSGGSPFWAEEFYFEDFEGKNFKSLDVYMWSESEDLKTSSDDRLLGWLSIPASPFLLLPNDVPQHEHWIPLLPPSIKAVNGEIRLIIERMPEMSHGKATAFSLTVVSCRNLKGVEVNGLADPYVVVQWISASEELGKHQTNQAQHTVNPTFNETFIIDVNLSQPDAEIYVSVWHWDKEFLGYVVLSGLQDIEDVTDMTLQLLPLPIFTDLAALKKPKKIPLPDSFIRTFLPQLGGSSGNGSNPPSPKPTHTFQEMSHSQLEICSVCADIITADVTFKHCSSCKLSFHLKCIKHQLPCGSQISCRVIFKYSQSLIFSRDDYQPLVDLLQKEHYLLAVTLGQVSLEREDAARSLVRIFHSADICLPFIYSMIDADIASADNPRILFRANSMASKVIDVYMKLVGSSYMKHILSAEISKIIQEGKSCEVDPSKVTKSDNIKKNWIVLEGYCTSIIEAIFSEAVSMPTPLNSIFEHVRKAVSAKFPSDIATRYTSVSGFIFLRFFAPSILGPRLFNLSKDAVTPTSSRTLTLIAKILQNLANLVPFGQKESYMTPINRFIEEKIPEMEAYLDVISLPPPPQSSASRYATIRTTILTPPVSEPSISATSSRKMIFKKASDYFDVDFCKECSRLSNIIHHSQEQLSKALNSEMLTELERILVITNDDLDKFKQSNGSGINVDVPLTDPTAPTTEQILAGHLKRQSLLQAISRKVVERIDSRPVMGAEFSESTSSQSHTLPIQEAPALRRVSPISATASKCFHCEAPTDPSLYTCQDRVFCPTHYEMAISNGFCTYCTHLITGPYRQVSSQHFHLDHLFCSVCKVALSDSCYSYNEKIYCKIHYYETAGMVCKRCCQALDGQYVELEDGTKYHVSCAVCLVCKRSVLDIDYRLKEGELYCKFHGCKTVYSSVAALK